MNRLWVRIIKGHRIVRHDTVECAWGGQREALISMCKKFDIPAPMWLTKHEREFEDFRRTAFLRADFVEEVPFDRLEVEFLEDGVKRRSSDPRNDFG